MDEGECFTEKLFTTHEIKHNKTIKQLKQELANHGLKKTGNKAELIERLLNHYEECNGE